MVSAAPSYDKLKDPQERKAAYIQTIEEGADGIESDLPIEVGQALQQMNSRKDSNRRYFGTRKISRKR